MTTHPASAANGRRPLTIDLHCHLLVPEVEALVANRPGKLAETALQREHQGDRSFERSRQLFSGCTGQKLTDIPTRLADMDRMGVDIQAISPVPLQYYYWAEDDLAEEIVRLQNEWIATVCAGDPDRFVGFATVALQNPKMAVAQLDHAVKHLALRGVQVSSLVNGVDVADPRFDPFWSRAEALGAVVFLHPMGTSIGSRLNKHFLANIVGQPAETAIALSQMIFGGNFDRFPDLKLLAAHGGGYLPLYIGRSDHAYAVRPESRQCKHRPSDYLKRIWFDTVVFDPEHLKRLIDAVGVGQIVVGTDYPADMGDQEVHALVSAISGIDDTERAAILGLNAARLLGLDPAIPAA